MVLDSVLSIREELDETGVVVGAVVSVGAREDRDEAGSDVVEVVVVTVRVDDGVAEGFCWTGDTFSVVEEGSELLTTDGTVAGSGCPAVVEDDAPGEGRISGDVPT